jgi:hypothetical protein
MGSLVAYARNKEKDMFELAPDKAAYYHMLTEKIYKSQKEIEEKTNRRLNERQKQQYGQQQKRGAEAEKNRMELPDVLLLIDDLTKE